MFEGMNNVTKVQELFVTEMSLVVSEREDYLGMPMHWDCKDDEGPTIAQLSTLAGKLPGWYYPDVSGGLPPAYKMRPVYFDSFSSIIGEFLREYECKLTLMQANTIEAVMTGNDTETPCEAEPCPTIAMGDIAMRARPYHEILGLERHRARVAVERTLHTLRSFEVNYTAARNLLCFERASLDLKNELGLLANTTSCIPKIWDALTSIHDRKY
jgi:hypothetical protein